MSGVRGRRLGLFGVGAAVAVPAGGVVVPPAGAGMAEASPDGGVGLPHGLAGEAGEGGRDAVSAAAPPGTAVAGTAPQRSSPAEDGRAGGSSGEVR